MRPLFVGDLHWRDVFEFTSHFFFWEHEIQQEPETCRKNNRPELDHLIIHLQRYQFCFLHKSSTPLTKPKQRCHWCWSGWLHRYARVMPVGGGTKDWFKLFKLFKLLDSAVGYRALPIVKERSICSLFIAVCDSC